MTQNKNQNILYIKTKIIYIIMQCLNFFQQVASNELTVKTYIQINTTAIVPKDVYSKLILTMLKNYLNYVTIISSLQIKQKSNEY